MKKFTLIVFALLAIAWQTHAQLSADDACTTSFDDISATGTDLFLADDGEANITLPFAFTLDGVSSSNMRVGDNGSILFNATTGQVGTSSTPTAQGFYAFSDDLDSDFGNILWQVLGTAPNRRAVIMWNDRPHYYFTQPGTSSGATFEIILYETSNEITFLYQDTDFADPAFNDGISAGVRVVGANGAYVYSTNTSIAGISCINWTVPTCPAPSGVTIDSYNASSATVSWTPYGAGTDFEIAFQAGGAGEPAGAGTATSSNPHIQLSLTGSTVYDVYVREDCGGSDFSDWVGPVSFTTDASTVPACVSSYTATPDVACGNFDTALSWTGVVADGYYITVGTTTGGNDIMDNVDLGNVTSTTISSQNAGTTYYYTISPYNVIGTNTTCTEQTYTTFATGCYCDSIPSSNDGAGVSNVKVGITDFASGDVTYIDHSGYAEPLGQGLSANLEITFQTGYEYSVNVWIDFNDNYTFEPGEKVHGIGLSSATNPTTYQADFTMPPGADIGIHKMRIVTADNDTLDNACYNGTYGVTLDFDVEVTAVACTAATVDSVTVVDNCAAGTYTVDVDVSDVGSGDGFGTTLFIWGASFDPLVLGINTAGPFPIGGPAENVTILDALDNTCSIDLGDFSSSSLPPSGLAAFNFTSTTTDMAWTSNGSETSWEVLVLAGGDPAPVGTTPGTDTSGSNPYTITGLTSQTDYDAYVRAVCGTDLDWVGPVSFTTACDVFTPDYAEDFTTFLDVCWEQANGGNLTTGPLNFGTGAFVAEEFAHVGSGNGAVNINMYLGSPDIDWLLSPAFDLSADGYQLEVDVAMTDYNATTQIDGFSTGDEVRIVYSYDGILWTDLAVYNDTNVPAAAGQTEIIDLTGITGTIVRFAFYVSEGTDNGRDIDFHIDNFKVRTPPTCFDVSGLTLDAVTSTTADISWTAAGAETNWEIAVQSPGTGEPAAFDGSGADTASNNPYTATGLTAQTDYEVYVRAECTAGIEFGAWIGPLNFSTACAIQTAPYTETFENAGAVPDCWTLGGDENWRFSNTGAGNHIGNNGTLTGTTPSAGYFAWVDDSTPDAANAELTSPLVDVSPLTTPALSFYLTSNNEGSLNATLTVDVWDGAAWNTMGTYSGNTSGWEEQIINLAGLTFTGPAQARFSIADSGDFYDDIAIDDVSFLNGPTCYDPSDIAVTPFATTADISWTAGSTGETNWEIAVQAAGTGEPAAADGSGADTASNNPYSATGLTAETAYEVYVRAECTAGTDFSEWVGPFNFTTTPDCPTVSAITLDSVTGTTAELSWTAGNSETNWEIAIQAPLTGEPAAADDAGTNTASNPYAATGLTAETDYEVYVRAECTLTTSFSSWVGPFNFTTPCAAITPDYVANMSTNAPDAGACWVEAGSGEVAAGPGGLGVSDWTTGSYVYGASNRLNLYSNVDREWLLSPPFDLSADGYELVVNVGVTNWNSGTVADTMGSDDSVQLLMSTDNGATWTNLTTWTAADALQPSGTDYIEDLAGVTGSNVLFAIMASDGTVDNGEDYDFHVGRFEVRTPPSCPEVIALTASNITTTSADIGWTNGGSETAWEVAIQTPGTGEPAATNDSGTNSATNPYNATGLTSNTSYEVYVRAECVDGVEFGLWTGPFIFSTPCDVVSDFSENFDSVTTPNLPDCWSGIIDNGASSFASVTTSTSADSSLPNGVSLYNSDSVSTSNIILVSPELSNLGDGTHRLTFNGRNSTATQDIEVGTLSNPTDGSTFTALTTVDLATTFAGYEVSFAGYVGSDNYIGIRRLSTSTYTYVYLDDITWEAIPSCLAVTDIAVANITTTSADISWTAADSETNWEIAVQAAGTGEPAAADGSGTDTATNNPYSATGLSGSTGYEVWVRAECTAGVDFGEWVGPFNFDTACDTFSTFPYTEGFESGVPPTCWTSFRGTNDEGTTYDWTTTATANTGSQAAYVRYSVSGNDAEDWLVTPEFDFSALTNPEFSFFTREGLTTDYGSTLTVRVSTTDTAHASFTTVYTSSETDITTYNQLVINLSTYAGASTVYVAIVWANDDGDSLYVDDVTVYDNIPGTYTYNSGVWTPSTPLNDLDDIIIASGDLVVSSDFTCNTMTVNPGASVTVNSGTTLEATNGLSLESSSTSYSSLIRNGSIVGAMTYDRHVNINGSGTTGSNDLVSAPLTGQQFNDFVTANPNILNNGTLYLFGPFSKTAGYYVNWPGTETSTLDPGVGYRSGSTDNGTYTFTGADNIGIITHDISNSGPNNQEWNLVGNPYPSYLGVQAFLTEDVGGVVNIQLFDAPTAAIYGYDGSALNGWRIYNLSNTTASTKIAPGQGFFVSADATNAPLYDLEFTPSMRRTGTGDDFIVGRNAELTYIKLNASTATNSYNTEFYFNANATEGFDLGYDAAIWGNTTPDFALYSHLIENNAGDVIALQALNSSNLSDVSIPLGVKSNQGEQLTFSIADMNVPATVKVYLEDVVKNTTTLLNDGDYVITPTTDLSGTGRFFLRTSNDALSSIDNSLDNLNIFTLKASDELVVSGELLDNTLLTLYDIQGRLVLSSKLDHTILENRIDVSSINSGVYIVTILNSGQEKTKKVIID